MLDLFHYSFMIRALEAGIAIGILAPFIGIFLVLRRYSLIADTLSHISLCGVAVGLLLQVNPLVTALLSTAISSIVIERLRLSKRIYGESALAIFLSGSLAVATILISLSHGFRVNIFNYLFGSILTVRQSDVYLIGIGGAVVIILLILCYKELVYITFDEESARVSGIPTRAINTLFIVLVAITVSLAIPVVGMLLISALMVIPVITALQFRRSFITTIIYSEVISVFSVVGGIFASYYLGISTGGTIVLITVVVFILSFLWTSQKRCQ